MTVPDLNLLVALDVLLTEGSVAAAARRLNLSPSAMSRTLARLRQATGDPLLVRAGRGLVPTPRALELRDQVAHTAGQAIALLRPAIAPDLRHLRRTFVIRCREGFVESFGAALLSAVSLQAPNVCLSFQPKTDKDSTPLRSGDIDLDTGVVGDDTAPELRARALFHDSFVVAFRAAHPLGRAALTPAAYAAADHVVTARRGPGRGFIDQSLERLGLERRVVALVGSFTAALALVRGSDLVTAVPDRQTRALRAGLGIAGLPGLLPDVTVSLMWHPRQDADPAHRWLRDLVQRICAAPDDQTA